MSRKSKIMGLIIALLVVVGLIVLDSSNPLLSIGTLFFVFGMAGSFNDYTENKVLDHILKTASFTVPTNIYIALFTAAPTDSGGGTEVTGGSYARVLHNSWDAAAAGASENTGAITFVEATASWGTVVAFALFDAVSGGNMLAWGDLTTSKAIGSGDTASFADGELDITLD